MPPIKAVRGVRDILPVEAGRWQRAELAARRVFEAYGYREIRLPVFERTELFARGIGDETDIVKKEMYTFEDRSGESITLRPEATASILRAYIEHGFHVEPKPVRLYTLGPMFRYERPQAGRYRQFHQADVEALGETHPALDAEVIVMLMDFFAALGLGQRLELHVNSIGDAGTRPAYVARLIEYLAPRRAELCDECQARLARNALRVLDCKTPGCQPIIEKAPSILDSLSPDAAQHFDSVRQCLEALAVPYVVNPRLVRGLDYYVRTTFEVLTTELGAQNAVAGGGRYDGLIEQLDGPPDPGIGFAIGLERVVLLLGEAERRVAPFALLAPLGEPALRRLLPVAHQVRRRGLSVELGYGVRKLPKELERANRLGVPYVVIVGDNELVKGIALLRDMASGTQHIVPIESLADKLAELNAAQSAPR
ncbi:MAG TPA: histidine--tRNA ligase [Methylomirabilota bacterium]|jgi:histidyl-tRNA synthetase|nr:histidine--tRNA ligase [Methylomirabilota bacterium]